MAKYNNLINDNTFKNKYTRYWMSKPLWCKPWSIILTGITFQFLAYYFIHSIIIDFVISSLVILWWIIFLFIAPISYNYEGEDLNINE